MIVVQIFVLHTGIPDCYIVFTCYCYSSNNIFPFPLIALVLVRGKNKTRLKKKIFTSVNFFMCYVTSSLLIFTRRL